jgi:hypothetical protein
LGQWNVPDRSTQISDRPQSDALAPLFIDGLKDLAPEMSWSLPFSD